MSADKTTVDAPRYPHNSLEGFGNGCLLDLRVRFAMQLLATSPMYAGGKVTIVCETDAQGLARDAATIAATPGTLATHALDTATALFERAESRGLIEPLPDHSEISTPARNQARRLGAFEVAKQLGAQQYAQEQQSRVSIPQSPIAGRPN